MRALCDSLDEVTLLPDESPFLDVETDDAHVHARFADERLTFLSRDVKRLPIANVTVEALAIWMLGEVTNDDGFRDLPIETLTLRVSSGPGQWASADWRA